MAEVQIDVVCPRGKYHHRLKELIPGIITEHSKVLRDSMVLEHSTRMGVIDKPRREQNSHEDPENPSFLIHQEGSNNRDSPTRPLIILALSNQPGRGFPCCEF